MQTALIALIIVISVLGVAAALAALDLWPFGRDRNRRRLPQPTWDHTEPGPNARRATAASSGLPLPRGLAEQRFDSDIGRPASLPPESGRPLLPPVRLVCDATGRAMPPLPRRPQAPPRPIAVHRPEPVADFDDVAIFGGVLLGDRLAAAAERHPDPDPEPVHADPVPDCGGDGGTRGD